MDHFSAIPLMRVGWVINMSQYMNFLIEQMNKKNTLFDPVSGPNAMGQITWANIVVQIMWANIMG